MELLPRVCLPLGRSFTNEPKCGDVVPQVTSSITSKAVEKNVPLSLYPVYATNKLNFQELE